jgi:hypothetical protein
VVLLTPAGEGPAWPVRWGGGIAEAVGGPVPPPRAGRDPAGAQPSELGRFQVGPRIDAGEDPVRPGGDQVLETSVRYEYSQPCRLGRRESDPSRAQAGARHSPCRGPGPGRGRGSRRHRTRGESPSAPATPARWRRASQKVCVSERKVVNSSGQQHSALGGIDAGNPRRNSRSSASTEGRNRTRPQPRNAPPSIEESWAARLGGARELRNVTTSRSPSWWMF